MIVIKSSGTFLKRITAGAVSAVLGLSCLSWSSPQRIDAAASAADQWIFREANDAAAYTDRVDGETIHLDWEGTPLRGIISKEYYSDYQMSAQIKKDSDSPWTSIQLGISDYPAVTIDDGVYYLRNANSGKYLDVSANSGTDGTNIQQWEFIGGNAQKFKFVSDGDGYYTIYTGSTRFNGCVDVDYGSVQNGTNIQQWAASGADNQKFRLVKTGDTYVITTKSTNGTSCLDVSDYSLENGANVHQWFFLDTANQKWYLEPAPAELDPDTASTGNGLDITNKTDLVSICYSVWFDGILGTGYRFQQYHRGTGRQA